MKVSAVWLDYPRGVHSGGVLHIEFDDKSPPVIIEIKDSDTRKDVVDKLRSVTQYCTLGVDSNVLSIDE